MRPSRAAKNHPFSRVDIYYFIFALFIPDSEAGTTHLKLLSLVARSLMRKEVTEQLRAAKSKIEIATILTKEIGEDI